MIVTEYSISWLYGEFKIARYKRGRMVDQFTADQLVESPTDFVNALREARTVIGIKRKGKVAIVHEHDLHTHSYMEIPYMRKRDLEKYLQRKVAQESGIGSELAWCYHEAKHADGNEGVLLHMVPKSIVDTTVVTCMAMGLTPKRYVPLTEIVSHYIPKLNIKDEEIALVVALFHERAELIVCLGDGEALFVRELSFGTSNRLQDRLSMDINRTVRYTKQQTGKTITDVWIVGERPDDVMSALGDVTDLRIHLDKNSEDENFWLDQAARMPGRLSANFVSIFTQKNITKESVKRVGVWFTLALMVSASVVTASMTKKAREFDSSLQHARAENEFLVTETEQLELRMTLSEQKLNRLINLQSNSLNMPSIFLLHLSRLTPPQLVLKDVEVLSDNGGWSVAIRGDVNQSAEYVSDTLDQFETSLQDSPWNMNVSKSWKVSWYQQFKNGILRNGKKAHFEIEGRLQ
ncbi:MAG: hypothetical protein KTR35_23345 [Gammaproteobacteria bacterium]|nr:hypothetical protein [Gammaproteobacteria bacterium]